MPSTNVDVERQNVRCGQQDGLSAAKEARGRAAMSFNKKWFVGAIEVNQFVALVFTNSNVMYQPLARWSRRLRLGHLVDLHRFVYGGLFDRAGTFQRAPFGHTRPLVWMYVMPSTEELVLEIEQLATDPQDECPRLVGSLVEQRIISEYSCPRCARDLPVERLGISSCQPFVRFVWRNRWQSVKTGTPPKMPMRSQAPRLTWVPGMMTSKPSIG